MINSYFQEEEAFHSQDKKRFKKERKIAQNTDRSKTKKTNLDSLKQHASPSPITEDFPIGRVLSVKGEGIEVDIDGIQVFCSLKGKIKKDKTQAQNLVAVGDRVKIKITNPGQGLIVDIEKRTSTLSRLNQSGRKEQLLIANVDLVFVVVSIGDPQLKPALVDRYLIAAKKGNMQACVVINKVDLLEDASEEVQNLYQEFVSVYKILGIDVISVSTKNGIGLDLLRQALQDKTSVFSGQSGTGKSSILNALFGLSLKTGETTQKTHKGSHTTTSAQLLRLNVGGFCVDTPGIRSFGLWNLSRADLIDHFYEFASYSEQCRYPNCTHLLEPSCAVQVAVEEGLISLIRFESYRSLINSLIGNDDNRTQRKLEGYQ